MTRGVELNSWQRNDAWVRKFHAYALDNCPADVRAGGMQAAAKSDTLCMAFLGHVQKQQPRATTRVDAAKRALNLLRSMAGAPPLESNPGIQLLAKAARNIKVHTTRQSPGTDPDFIAAIVLRWGKSSVWWKRQTALMVLLSFCTLARGAGICLCLRLGVVWVDSAGLILWDSYNLRPHRHCTNATCKDPNCVIGTLLLIPWRKNKQSTPSWIPVAEKNAIVMLGQHMRWLTQCSSKSTALFLARASARSNGKRVYVPNTGTNSRMSTTTYRSLFRQALRECCGLTSQQASEAGTHSNRIGAIELLRKRGVPKELRQQMGDWMSKAVALRYLQLHPEAQFNILDSV